MKKHLDRIGHSLTVDHQQAASLNSDTEPMLVGCSFAQWRYVGTRGAFGWYDLEQDRTAGAHGAASCQPNGTLETEHIFVEKCAKLGAFFKMCMGHHGHLVRYDESNPKAYARDHLGTKSMFPPGFTVKK